MVDTFKQYNFFLQNFGNLYGCKLVVEIKPPHITNWLNATPTWKGARWHATTAVKRVYSWGTGEGYLETNPIKGVKKPPTGKRERLLTEEERTEIIKAIRVRSSATSSLPCRAAIFPASSPT
ncbi:hypothetical protein [Zavarzinella formosa]|uniref:hypothetical protein n=1 Tax=Zavarzinella formosa TaxID=360055 RepID=UPI0002DEFD76|nr:hypothetical protein [Zavarzinella formosa]